MWKLKGKLRDEPYEIICKKIGQLQSQLTDILRYGGTGFIFKTVGISDQVKIGKSSQAKFWLVLGEIHPLPFMGGEMFYLLGRGKRKIQVRAYQIYEIAS